jgi:hypothetical protein
MFRQRRHRPDRQSENPPARSALEGRGQAPRKRAAPHGRGGEDSVRFDFRAYAISGGSRLGQVPCLNSGLEEKMSLATAFKNFAPKGSRRPSSAVF